MRGRARRVRCRRRRWRRCWRSTAADSSSSERRPHPKERPKRELRSMQGGWAIDRFVVISGCSGGGKSSLLEELGRCGYATVEEPGRRIVKEELRSGGTALP